MKSPTKSALLWGLFAAIPVEVVNFFLLAYPIDVGIPDDASWFVKVKGFQWLILHWPGLIASNWFDGAGMEAIGVTVIFLSGYIDTALLIIVGIFFVRWIRRGRSQPI